MAHKFLETQILGPLALPRQVFMRRLLCAGCSKVGQPGEGVKLDVGVIQKVLVRVFNVESLG